MIVFTIEQQINALLKHANRNKVIIERFEIIEGYKGEYISNEGACVFAHLPQSKSGGYPYFTMPSLIKYRSR